MDISVLFTHSVSGVDGLNAKDPRSSFSHFPVPGLSVRLSPSLPPSPPPDKLKIWRFQCSLPHVLPEKSPRLLFDQTVTVFTHQSVLASPHFTHCYEALAFSSSIVFD